MFLVYVYFKVLLYLQRHFGRKYAAVKELHLTNTVAPRYIAHIEKYDKSAETVSLKNYNNLQENILYFSEIFL